MGGDCQKGKHGDVTMAQVHIMKMVCVPCNITSILELCSRAGVVTTDSAPTDWPLARRRWLMDILLGCFWFEWSTHWCGHVTVWGQCQQLVDWSNKSLSKVYKLLLVIWAHLYLWVYHREWPRGGIIRGGGSHTRVGSRLGRLSLNMQ